MFRLPDKVGQEEKNNRKSHIVFKDDELKILWKHKNAGVNDYAIKRMVGHSISDITEGVYTERPLIFLQTELSKVSK